jgi:antimicrobial peptide system SdpB family protein
VSAVTRALAFDPRTTALGIGRSLIAVAELTVVLFTPDTDLFPGPPNRPPRPFCAGLHGVSLWCVGAPALTVVRILTIAVLLVVAAGYRPRWTCVPHWYVTFSLSTAMYAPNGGEHAATLATLLLIPMCLGDDRVWQWRAPDAAMPPTWRGAAYASHIAIRGQIALIYGEAVLSKLTDPVWRNGTAMYYVFQDANFGTSEALRRFLESGILQGWFVPAITWATVAIELFLTVAAFGGRTVRATALVVGALLHGGTIVLLGLPSFGLAMIGLLTLSYGGAMVRQRGLLGRRSPTKVSHHDDTPDHV